ncbi:hypothetical protein GCM10023205_54580 [Yinghuangia aomiensis]|uniref:Uncharacterized protein n=1 Tax=Yinghuangia aomiensis TaxID=676205 RepID=A0ABP9HUU1_9ACTN
MTSPKSDNATNGCPSGATHPNTAGPARIPNTISTTTNGTRIPQRSNPARAMGANAKSATTTTRSAVSRVMEAPGGGA